MHWDNSDMVFQRKSTKDAKYRQFCYVADDMLLKVKKAKGSSRFRQVIVHTRNPPGIQIILLLMLI